MRDDDGSSDDDDDYGLLGVKVSEFIIFFYFIRFSYLNLPILFF